MGEEGDSLHGACTDLRRAAGTLRYLLDNFSHAPSADLQPQSVAALAQLLLAQAQVCAVRKFTGIHRNPPESYRMLFFLLGHINV